MNDTTIVRIGCLSSAAAWRREASLIRELAEAPHRSEAGRQVLLAEAEAADRQADDWLEAAMIG
jgi:hypothetical protein